jgi:hypothetical protein
MTFGAIQREAPAEGDAVFQVQGLKTEGRVEGRKEGGKEGG